METGPKTPREDNTNVVAREKSALLVSNNKQDFITYSQVGDDFMWR